MLDKSKLHLEHSIDKEGHDIQRWHKSGVEIKPSQPHGMLSIQDLLERRKREQEQKEPVEPVLGQPMSKENVLKWLDSISPGGHKTFRAKGLNLHVGRRSDGVYYTGEGLPITGAYTDYGNQEHLVGRHRLADDLAFYSGIDHNERHLEGLRSINQQKAYLEHLPKMRKMLREELDPTSFAGGAIVHYVTSGEKNDLRSALDKMRSMVSKLETHEIGESSKKLSGIKHAIEDVSQSLIGRAKLDGRIVGNALSRLNTEIFGLDKEKNIPIEAKHPLSEKLKDMDYPGMSRTYGGITLKRTDDGYVIDGEHVKGGPEHAEEYVKAKLYGYEHPGNLYEAEIKHSHDFGSETKKETIRKTEAREAREAGVKEAQKAQAIDRYRRNYDKFMVHYGAQYSIAGDKLYGRENWHRDVAEHIARSESDPDAGHSDVHDIIVRLKKDAISKADKDRAWLNSKQADFASLDGKHLGILANDVQTMRTMHHNAAAEYEKYAKTGEHTDLHTAHANAVKEADNTMEAIRKERAERKVAEDKARVEEQRKRWEEEDKQRKSAAEEIRKRLPEITDEHKRMYPADKWTKKQIIIADFGKPDNRSDPVDAHVRGVWAVHKGTEEKTGLKTKGIMLTHIPTGMSAGAFGRLSALKRALDDWMAEDPERAHKGAFAEFGRKGVEGEKGEFVNELGKGGHIQRLRDLYEEHEKAVKESKLTITPEDRAAKRRIKAELEQQKRERESSMERSRQRLDAAEKKRLDDEQWRKDHDVDKYTDIDIAKRYADEFKESPPGWSAGGKETDWAESGDLRVGNHLLTTHGMNLEHVKYLGKTGMYDGRMPIHKFVWLSGPAKGQIRETYSVSFHKEKKGG